ncbi:hypothetical protein GCM10022252_54600 [Streptosporangium oxazolinicum]|uniref:Uncharacterized protein n=1 Tax=Streptosporangium oxazolinicum TaxID=909287 RepID=A0ABP8B8N4_9ACTN
MRPLAVRRFGVPDARLAGADGRARAHGPAGEDPPGERPRRATVFRMSDEYRFGRKGNGAASPVAPEGYFRKRE